MPRNLRLDDVLTRHQVFVQRLSSGEAQKFAKFLREMDKELRARLSGDELTEFSRRRLERLLADVDKMLAELYGDFTKGFASSAQDIAQHEAEFTSRALKVVADIDTGIPALSQIRAAVFTNPLAVRGPGGGKLLKDFLTDWSQTEIKAVTGAIRRGVFEGQTNSQIVRVIRGTAARKYADGLLETSARHARAVVQTAVQHVSSAARLATFAENDDIVVGVQWLATLDRLTCQVCASLDLKEFPNDKGPRPPLHVNCFPADTLVSTRHRITGAVKRRFDGDLIVVRTAVGNELTCTPNHPVLTARGWVAAGLIQEGDDLVAYVGDSRLAVDDDHQRVPASIEEAAETFLRSDQVVAAPMPVAAEDFHGDGMDGDVAVVGSDRLLGHGIEAMLAQFSRDEFLVTRDMSLTPLSRRSALDTLGHWYAAATDSLKRKAREALSLCRGCASHAGELLLGAIPQLDAGTSKASFSSFSPDAEFAGNPSNSKAAHVERHDLRDINAGLLSLTDRRAPYASLVEQSIDDGVADAEMARDIIDGLHGAIRLDRVVRCDRRAFSGHVYNLETESGWYIANGIVTHNCRCTVTAVLSKEFAALNQRTVRPSVGPDGAEQQSAGINYYTWLKQQPREFIDEAIGPRRAQLLLNGGLSADRFAQLQLDKNFEPMTLADAKRLEPLAFKEAGL